MFLLSEGGEMICKNHYIHREHHKQIDFMSDRKRFLKTLQNFHVSAVHIFY